MVKKTNQGGIETDFKTKFSNDFRENPERAYTNLRNVFSFLSVDLTAAATELPTLSIKMSLFAEYLVTNIYRRILFVTLGYVALHDEQKDPVINTCMDRYSPFSRGLVSIMARAIATNAKIVLEKKQLSDGSYKLVLVNKTQEEIDNNDLLIELDYTRYHDSKLIKLYTEILYDALLGAFRGIYMTQSVLLGLYNLSEMLETDENNIALIKQVKAISEGLRNGRTSYVDSNSKVEFVKFDIEPTSKVKEFVYNQYSNLTGFPLSFFNGAGGSSLSDTGESDAKAIRKAAEFYFYEMLNPALTAIFGGNFELRPDIDVTELSIVLSTVETTSILSVKGAELLLSEAGLGKEHIDLSNYKSEPQPPAVNNINNDDENDQDEQQSGLNNA